MRYRKPLLSLVLVALVALLSSWGVTGHRTIGLLAERHLTPQAKAAVKELLADETLAQVSTYADEIRSKEAYRYTAPWHYINLPAGLHKKDFMDSVIHQNRDNIYKALQKCQSDLKDPLKTREEKIFALKFIVHIVGDLHQPMHTGRAEDLGGNRIRITFLNKPGNLHGLWDSRLVEHEGLTYEQLADKIGHTKRRKIRKLQRDDLIKWLHESYQLSERLYDDAAKNANFDEAYYQKQVPVFEDRMERAGIRLAGVLNEIFQ
ncbi:S1/P1 nuclease [Olivibacter sp. XZL3]|uniref:S1/P1 nuclease n=1 Tax=Olivibacter sp. XZL3 TaxID=1735116 RepID=UPI0010664D0D|nr:S1/P1 nuclease [Olivibacter sp. XZL3]